MTFPLTNFSSILSIPTHVLITQLIAQRNAINAFLASRVKPKKERAPRKPRAPKLNADGSVKERTPRKPRVAKIVDPNKPIIAKVRKKRMSKAEKEFIQKMQTLKERMRSLRDDDAEKIMIKTKLTTNNIITEKEWEEEWLCDSNQ